MNEDRGGGRQGWREGWLGAAGGGGGGWRRKEGGSERVSKRKGRRVDLWGLKHISIHGEEEATDSRETEGPD